MGRIGWNQPCCLAGRSEEDTSRILKIIFFNRKLWGLKWTISIFCLLANRPASPAFICSLRWEASINDIKVEWVRNSRRSEAHFTFICTLRSEAHWVRKPTLRSEAHFFKGKKAYFSYQNFFGDALILLQIVLFSLSGHEKSIHMLDAQIWWVGVRMDWQTDRQIDRGLRKFRWTERLLKKLQNAIFLKIFKFPFNELLELV